MSDAEMKVFNQEVANKIYTFLNYMTNKPPEDQAAFLSAMGMMYPRNWDQPKLDPNFSESGQSRQKDEESNRGDVGQLSVSRHIEISPKSCEEEIIIASLSALLFVRMCSTEELRMHASKPHFPGKATVQPSVLLRLIVIQSPPQIAIPIPDSGDEKFKRRPVLSAWHSTPIASSLKIRTCSGES